MIKYSNYCVTNRFLIITPLKGKKYLILKICRLVFSVVVICDCKKFGANARHFSEYSSFLLFKIMAIPC